MIALTANVASTLGTYPHTLSYFNEVAGGPLNGPAHLLDANGYDPFLADVYAAFRVISGDIRRWAGNVVIWGGVRVFS